MKKKNFITYGLLVAAGVLLLGSAIGSTQAALTYYSENYTAEITISQIGVSLMENGKVVSSRDYNEDKWDISTNKKDSTSASGALLTNMLKKDEKLALNKKYDEVLRVKNSGSIDQYVRVSIYRYWTYKDGKKVTALSPDLIDLRIKDKSINDKEAYDGSRWVKNPESTRECMELYYKGILPSESESESFAENGRAHV